MTRARGGCCGRCRFGNSRLAVVSYRVQAVPPGGDAIPLAITLGLLASPDGAPAGAVAVLRRADAILVPFGTLMAE